VDVVDTPARTPVNNSQARVEVMAVVPANDVASVIIARSGAWMDSMSLQKLLYYVQAWHLAVTDEPLFPEQIKAWKDGPVVPQVWHARKGQETRRAAAQDVQHVSLDRMTEDLIDLVIGSYGSMSGEELSALTHVEQPWIDARGDLPENAESREPVSQQAMATYYRAHRRLGGRTASDLAAGGIDVRGDREAGPVDVDEILESLGDEYSDSGTDRWGGANLDPGDQYDTEGIVHECGHTYADS
jgi:uncharacterized phage-associated protein